MKMTKRQWPLYAYYDHSGMARHLEKMAAKGWFLEKILTNGPWIYRRGEPKKVHYAVTYFPSASDYSAPDDDQQNFHELCAAAGWQLVARTFQIQIFCNEQEDPVPLDTDPMIQVENIHNALWSNYMISKVVFLAFAGFLLLKFISEVEKSPALTLSWNLSLLLPMLGLLLGLHQGTEIIAYYLWRRHALRMAEEEHRFLPTTGKMTREVVFTILYTAVILFNLLLGEWAFSLIILGFVLCFEGIRRVTFFVRDRMRDGGMKSGINRVITFLMMFVLITVLRTGEGTLINRVLDRQYQKTEYTYNGKTYTAYCNDLPLTIGDLTGADNSLYSTRLFQRSSPLASIISGYQSLKNGDYGEDVPPQSFFFHFYRSDLDLVLNDAAGWNISHIEYHILRLRTEESERIDPAPYGALEAWHTMQREEWNYLLRYEDHVIQLGFGWEPTQSQLMQAVNTLKAL